MLGHYGLGAAVTRTWENMPLEVKESWSIEDQFAWLQSDMPPAPAGERSDSAGMFPDPYATYPGGSAEGAAPQGDVVAGGLVPSTEREPVRWGWLVGGMVATVAILAFSLRFTK